MPFRIVRNDITKMETDAIVNTANDYPTVGTGCDHAVYEAAGFSELLDYRVKNIGFVPEGDVFLTPGFHLPAKHIIHAVSPHYYDGKHGEEKLLRSCYRKSLELAARQGFRSIAFPLISTGGFCYPKEEGMRIAVDEIHAFLLHSDMQVYLVVFDRKATQMGKNLYPDLEAYIDQNYVEEKHQEEYDSVLYSVHDRRKEPPVDFSTNTIGLGMHDTVPDAFFEERELTALAMSAPVFPAASYSEEETPEAVPAESAVFEMEPDAIEEMERKLQERIEHMTDTFSEYLLYLIKKKGLKNSDAYKGALLDKKVFSKIKNNRDYHPEKRTALRLCIGANLNLDESKDLLSRAGYALSPCDKTDIIFSYFIEKRIYDIFELDIQLEEHGEPCIIY
ncbi:MAG: macro domain-containing protein [Clostridia bacterium]|nr:macro domain-containing protein [Clostridia bacterium]